MLQEDVPCESSTESFTGADQLVDNPWSKTWPRARNFRETETLNDGCGRILQEMGKSVQIVWSVKGIRGRLAINISN